MQSYDRGRRCIRDARGYSCYRFTTTSPESSKRKRAYRKRRALLLDVRWSFVRRQNRGNGRRGRFFGKRRELFGRVRKKDLFDCTRERGACRTSQRGTHEKS